MGNGQRFFDLTLGGAHELFLALQKAGFSKKDAEEISKDPYLALDMLNTLKESLAKRNYLKQYSESLLSLRQQMMALKKFNGMMSKDMQVPEWVLDTIGIRSSHKQSVQHLETLFVVKDTFFRTLLYNWELIKISHNNAKFNISSMEELTKWDYHPSAQRYNEGIYIVCVDLTSNWSPNTPGHRLPFDELRRTTGKNRPATFEPIAAYALQSDDLLKSQEHGGMPPCDLLGIQHKDSSSCIPQFYWKRDSINLTYWHANSGINGFATPLVRKDGI